MNIAELDWYVGEAHAKFTQKFENYQNRQWEQHGKAKERAAMFTTTAAITMIAGATVVAAAPAVVAAAAAVSAVATGKMIYHNYMQQNAFERTEKRERAFVKKEAGTNLWQQITSLFQQKQEPKKELPEKTVPELAQRLKQTSSTTDHEMTQDKSLLSCGVDLNLAPQRLDFRPAALLRGFQASPSSSLKDAMARNSQPSSSEKQQQDAVSSEKKIKPATGPRMGA